MRIRGLISLMAVFGALLVPATAQAAVYDVHIFTVTLDSSGGLLIRGNLAGCPNGWTYKISGTVTQRQAGGTVTGDFSTSGTCTASLDRWRAFATPSSGQDFNTRSVVIDITAIAKNPANGRTRVDRESRTLAVQR